MYSSVLKVTYSPKPSVGTLINVYVNRTCRGLGGSVLAFAPSSSYVRFLSDMSVDESDVSKKRHNVSVSEAISSKDSNIVLTNNAGVQSVLTARGLAGLSPEYKEDAIHFAKLGLNRAPYYKNPGRYGMTNRLSDEIISVLPPPRKPTFPMTPWQHTMKYIKAASVLVLALGLAGYLFLKFNSKGVSRTRVEYEHPVFASILSSLGLLEESSFLENLDRNKLVDRVFLHYSLNKTTIPARAAASIFQSLSKFTVSQEAIESAVSSLNSKDLTRDEFVSALLKLTSTQSNLEMYVCFADLFGVVYAPKEFDELFGVLYDRVIARRSLKGFFSTSMLSELSSEVGLFADEELVKSCLQDAKFRGKNTGEYEKQLSPLPVKARNLIKYEIQDPLYYISREDFIDTMNLLAVGEGLNEERLKSKLELFYNLHMSGLREKAGIGGLI